MILLTNFFKKSWKSKLALLFIIILPFFLTTSGYSAIDKGFAWDANTEADLAGYRIYMSPTSGEYVLGEFSSDKIVEINCGPNPGGTESAIVHIPDGTWYFVATAFDTEGLESTRSEIELTWTSIPEDGTPPGCVLNFRFN